MGMAKMVDADKLLKIIRLRNPLGSNYELITASVVEYCRHIIQTESKVELVFCGECRFVDTDKCPMSRSPGRVSASDFCSYGERKDNDT